MSYHDEKDIFRHTALRYLGYTNEVAEAFRYHISIRSIYLAYGISTMYVLGDGIDKTIKKHNKSKLNSWMNKELYKTFFLTSLWQIVSTEILPGLSVFIIVKLTKNRMSKYSFKYKNFIPTLVGLGAIPIFPYTIDPVVDNLFDKLGLTVD